MESKVSRAIVADDKDTDEYLQTAYKLADPVASILVRQYNDASKEGRMALQLAMACTLGRSIAADAQSKEIFMSDIQSFCTYVYSCGIAFMEKYQPAQNEDGTTTKN